MLAKPPKVLPLAVSLLVATAGLAAAPQVAASPAMVRGANIAGGDFGTVPGTYGIDYTYPTKAEIDYYADRGFNALRLPFRWERVQPELHGPLDSAGDFERVRQVVKWITGRGMIAILDLHDYGGRNVDGVPAKVGSAALPASALEDRLGEAG